MSRPEERRGRARGLLRRRAGLVAFLAVAGPGLITASADNDAQGITTYSIVGAKTGYALLWLIPIAAIALGITQEIGARIGIVTGKGLGALIRERFGVRPAALAMLLLLVANVGTTAAEFAGIAASLEIFGVTKYVSVPVVLWLVTKGGYKRIERVFLALSAVYVAYVISGFLAHPDWSAAAEGLRPSFSSDPTFVLIAVGMVGTTITPWGQFFIQAYVVDKSLGEDDLRYERADVVLGVLATSVVIFFIIVATAATVHETGGSIVDAKDAALALEPLAGRFAETLFAFGLLNASLLAAGVLPLSTSYALCEAFGFELGLDEFVRDAPVFYGIIAFAIGVGAVIVLIPGISLVPILFVSAVVNGLLLAPMLVYVYMLANDRDLMGELRNGRVANALTLATIVLLAVLTIVLVVVAIVAV
jgi:NRAMP (natural resistance-associated macrophage protein)-like metal ion transporter